MTRRDCFKLMGAAALTAGAGSLLWSQRGIAGAGPLPSLRDVAMGREIFYGSCSDTDFAADPQYGALVAQQCRLLAPQLSWPSVAPHADKPLAWEDPDVAYALGKGLRLTGYHLLWHYRTPRWFQDIQGQDAAGKAVYEHIMAMGARYGKNTYSWNVVNEALNPKEGRPDGLRNESPFLMKMGADFFDFAFRAAQHAAPNVMRVYNDYDMEMDIPDHEARRTALLRLLDSLQKQGTPIDAVGLQSHLKPQYTFDEKRYRAFLREIASRNLKILITELDIFDTSFPGDAGKRDQMVADLYSRFLNAALDEPAVKAVVNWGLSDRYTWLGPNYDKKYARPDGLPQRPLPFDADLKPKSAFYAIMNAFNAAPQRSMA